MADINSTIWMITLSTNRLYTTIKGKDCQTTLKKSNVC